MKNLMYNERLKAFFRVKSGDEFIHEQLETITPTGIKNLLVNAYYDDEFTFDDLPEDVELANPVENVIYGHINSKIKDIRARREASIKEHDSYFQKIMDEYKTE